MKKYFLLLLLNIFASLAFAQKKVGSLSIIPRIGVNLSTMSNMDFKMIQGNPILVKERYKSGFVGGAEAEYGLLAPLSATLGVFYSMQGCHYTDAESEGETHRIGLSNNNINAQYIHVPLLANLYLREGFAVKAGFEAGFLLDANWQYETTKITIDQNGARTYDETEVVNIDMKDKFRGVNLYIPIGVSYEYMNVVLDARYHLPLTTAMKSPNLGERHKIMTFTVGYRFNL